MYKNEKGTASKVRAQCKKKNSLYVCFLTLNTSISLGLQASTDGSSYNRAIGRVRLFNTGSTRATLLHLREVYHLAGYADSDGAGHLVQLSQAR